MSVNKNILLMFLSCTYSLIGMDVASLQLLQSINKNIPEELRSIIKDNILSTKHWWYCDQVFPHNAQANSVHLNGDSFAVGLHDGRVCMLNAETGKKNTAFRCGKWVFSVYCDSDRVAVGSDYGNMGIFNVKTGEKCTSFPHDKSIFSVCLNADRLATGSYDKACIFDIKTGKKLISYKSQEKRFFSVDLDEDFFAIGLDDGNMRTINIKTGKKLISRKYRHSVNSVHLNHGCLAIGLNDGNVRIINIKTGEKIISCKYASSINSVRLVDNYLVIGLGDGNVYIVNAQTNEEIISFKLSDFLYSLDFDSNRIAVGLGDESRIFKRHADYTLGQLQLKKALMTWLGIEKPSKAILVSKKLNEGLNLSLFLSDVCKKCELDYAATIVVWNSFPKHMQNSILSSMFLKVKKYGK